MSASFMAQGVHQAFPSFLGNHYLDRSGLRSPSPFEIMGTVPQPRAESSKGGTAAAQPPAPGADRRASAGSNHAAADHEANRPALARDSDQVPSQAERPQHSERPAQVSSPGSYSSSMDPINPSMADNRYPSMSAQSFPWYNDYAGPSGTSYPRYGSSAANAASQDQYEVLAHNQLVSRAMDPAYTAAQMPVTWSSAQPFHHHHASYPSTPFPTPSYGYPSWPVQYPSPQTMAESPMASLAPATQSEFAGTIASPFQPQGVLPSRAIPIPTTQSAATSTSGSPDTVSASPSLSGSVSSHRAGPMRSDKKARKSDAGKELARPARGGPMSDMQKSKADLVRDLGACWRCRRYKKSCDGPGQCTNCMRGNFRVWPSSLGCRRGCLEELVAHLLPAHSTEILVPASRMMLKVPNWRFGTVNESQRQMIEEQLPMANTWQRLSLKVQSTGMYGSEFASLLEIVKNYQATQSRPNPLLEASIQLLDSTCDLYQHFVQSAWPLPPADLPSAIVTAQRAYAAVSKMFLTSALSGRRRDWLPSFLSMCMAFCAIMVMMDTAIAVPAQAQLMLWRSVHDVSRDLRMRLYPVTTDLLRASSNGTKPFALGCWSVNEHVNPQDGSIELVRSPEGMRMLGGDKPAFDGMRSLQEWIRRNIRLIDLGTKIIRSEPFTTPEVPSIAAVLKLFDL